MSVFVLDNISWKTDVDKLMEKYCIPRGSDDAERLGVLAREAEKAGKPKALFKVSYFEDRGHDFVVIDVIKFTSRVLRIITGFFLISLHAAPKLTVVKINSGFIRATGLTE